MPFKTKFVAANTYTHSKHILFTMSFIHLFAVRMTELRKRWVPLLKDDHDLNNFTNKEFIRKIWHACILHGYVDECFDTLGCFLDKMEIE